MFGLVLIAWQWFTTGVGSTVFDLLYAGAALVVGTCGAVVFVLEPYWRMKALTALGVAISARALSGVSAPLASGLALLAFWWLESALIVTLALLFSRISLWMLASQLAVLVCMPVCYCWFRRGHLWFLFRYSTCEPAPRSLPFSSIGEVMMVDPLARLLPPPAAWNDPLFRTDARAVKWGVSWMVLRGRVFRWGVQMLLVLALSMLLLAVFRWNDLTNAGFGPSGSYYYYTPLSFLGVSRHRIRRVDCLEPDSLTLSAFPGRSARSAMISTCAAPI